jgi:hypothetical protein
MVTVLYAFTGSGMQLQRQLTQIKDFQAGPAPLRFLRRGSGISEELSLAQEAVAPKVRPASQFRNDTTTQNCLFCGDKSYGWGNSVMRPPRAKPAPDANGLHWSVDRVA